MDNVVLFLHGFPLNRSMWLPQLEAVRAAGWSPVAPNFPGVAGAPLLANTSMDAFADHAKNVLESVGASRAVVVGLSMGGYVAFRLLERHPNVVRALVLADTRATPDSAEQAKGRLDLAIRLEREGLAGFVEGNIPKLVAAGAGDDVRSSLRQMHLDAGVAGTAAMARALAARPDSRPLLAGIRVPTLVVVGEHDALTPVSDAQAMHDGIPGSTLEVIPGAGHMSNMEAPEAFNRVLLGFLAGV